MNGISIILKGKEKMSNISGRKIVFQDEDATPKGAVNGGVKLHILYSDYPLCGQGEDSSALSRCEIKL